MLTNVTFQIEDKLRDNEVQALLVVDLSDNGGSA